MFIIGVKIFHNDNVNAGWLAGKPLLAMAGELWDSEQPVDPTYPDALSAPTSNLFTYAISTLLI